jgi:hypothetical protein
MHTRARVEPTAVARKLVTSVTMADDAYKELFPDDRDPRLVQTEWATGWGSIASGFGYAAEKLTQGRSGFGATIDQAGLAIFFLQRHRVELILKHTIHALGVEVPGSHGLGLLWDCVRVAVEARDPAAWASFSADHGGLIDALKRVDDTSFAFRYPVDRKGVAVDRPTFIDLDALHARIEDLYWHAGGLVGWLTGTADGDA